MSTELNKENLGDQGLLGSNQPHKHEPKLSQKQHANLPAAGLLRKPLKESNQIKPKPILGQNAGFKNIKKGSKETIEIFQDPIASITEETKKGNSTKESQTKLTGSDLDDFQAMVSPDVEFYKDLAEKRRDALNESIKENEELHIENEEQKEKIEELNIKNEKKTEKIDHLEEKVASLEQTVENARKIIDMISPCLLEEEEEKVEKEVDENIENSEDLKSATKEVSEPKEGSKDEDNDEKFESELNTNDN